MKSKIVQDSLCVGKSLADGEEDVSNQSIDGPDGRFPEAVQVGYVHSEQ